MSKRLERIRRNPKNVSLDELRPVLEDYGFELRQATGSHYIADNRSGTGNTNSGTRTRASVKQPGVPSKPYHLLSSLLLN